jgi:hypothetical protein
MKMLQESLLMRDTSRNPRLKTEVLFCLRKSWKAEGKAFGPLARLLFLRSSAFNLMDLVKMTD